MPCQSSCCGGDRSECRSGGSNYCDPAIIDQLHDLCHSGGRCPGPCGGTFSIPGPGNAGPSNTTTRSGTFRTPSGGNGRWTVTETRYDSGWRTPGSRSGSGVGSSISLDAGSSRGPASMTSSRGPGSHVSGSGISGSRSYLSNLSAPRRSGPDLGGGWTAEPGSPAASAGGSGSFRGGSQVSAAPSIASSYRSQASGTSSRRSAAPSQISGNSSCSRAPSSLRSGRSESILPSDSASQISDISSGIGSRASRYSGASRGNPYVPSPVSGVSSRRSGGSQMPPESYVHSTHGHRSHCCE